MDGTSSDSSGTITDEEEAQKAKLR